LVAALLRCGLCGKEFLAGRKMEKISVAIITKNEERNIRDCLESVRWADEVVVVDNGSTDDTVKICREYRAQVYQEEWKGYSGQKNSAIEKTAHLWVLSLDADERVTPELRDEIGRTLEAPEKSGYLIARMNFFLGRWMRRCGWYPDYNLRLFRKDRGRFQERSVHERVTVDGPTGTLRHPMEHHTYRSLSDFMQKIDGYTTLAALEMRKEGRRYSHFAALLHPPFTFLQMYLVRGGFLEGYMGLLLSLLISFYIFAKYSKLRELQDHEADPDRR